MGGALDLPLATSAASLCIASDAGWHGCCGQAPGAPDETQQFRYSFQLPTQAVVCTAADLRRCQRYRFVDGDLCIDNGNGDVQSYPAHISHVWDMAYMPHAETSLTMEDQAEADLIGEEIGTVGVDWQSGTDLAQAWNDMMQ
jgi:hypothetical protein